jgi:hypothetical protein
MRSKCSFLGWASFLVGLTRSLAQPAVPSLQLYGEAQTSWDTFHPYATFSASLGANLILSNSASSSGFLQYQWRFNSIDLPGQTNRAVILLNIQPTNAGDYTVVVTDDSGSVTSRVATLDIDSTFTKITTGPIVTDAGSAGGGTWQGATWGDYNNDGYPDLLLSSGNEAGVAFVPSLFRNNGDGTFSQVPAAQSLLSTGLIAGSAAWGDYDNDGNLDLYVATTGRNVLYRNRGDGSFTSENAGSPTTDSATTLGANWIDYDRDGFLDLFVSVFDASAHSKCFLYRNNGDGTFAKVTNTKITTDVASSVGGAWADYDNDGWPDLFVAGGRGPGEPKAPNRLYHNNGDGTFSAITNGSIVTDLGYSGTCAWGDFNNDGYMDLFVANILGMPNFLYLNNGDGTFTKVTNDIVATDISPVGSEECAWGDYDNDGFLDLFVANAGQPTANFTPVNFLYHNNGDGTFTKVTNGSPANECSDCFGASWVDYDNDGFLDLLATRFDGRGILLYHNNGNTNNWLKVRLVGTVSNRSAIGAKVRAKAFYRGASRWQLRQISGGSGWDGHNELEAHFGLGDATSVDTLRIEWPSGTVQEFQNVAARQLLTITEPPRLLASAADGVPRFSLKAWPGMQFVIQASSDLAAWAPIGRVTITNRNGVVQIIDTNPTASDGRFYRAVSQ